MYFSQVRIDPNDPETILYAGVKLHKSTDGGKTVTLNATQTIHDDVHAIWIDPSNSNHVIIGNDGGVAISWDMAKTWNFVHNMPVGLFYHVSYDMATPFNICGGMQDNYSWCGPSAVRGAVGIAGFNWATMQGGDGFVAIQDPTDYRIAYSESQDGNMVRIDRVTGETMSIRPQPNSGEPALRWNWDTPLVMSPHDPKVIYAAANKVFRSANRGLNWETQRLGSHQQRQSRRHRHDGREGQRHPDRERRRHPGVADDHLVCRIAEARGHRSMRAPTTGISACRGTAAARGPTSSTRFPDLPKGIWVSEVVPSRFDEGTAYATFDGHRQNDFETYIYVTHDFGQTWASAAGNLKGEVIKTLTEDLKNPDVLYVGAETGLFISIDRAKSWARVKANLPTVRIDEITLHPRDNAMILATHGRALWILDHLEPIQEYAKAQAAATDAELFTPPPYAMFRRPARDRNYEFWGDQTFFGENPPRRGDHLVAEQEAGRRREARDQGCGGSRSARDLGHTAGEQQQGRGFRWRAGICACSRIRRRRRRRDAAGRAAVGRWRRSGGSGGRDGIRSGTRAACDESVRRRLSGRATGRRRRRVRRRRRT